MVVTGKDGERVELPSYHTFDYGDTRISLARHPRLFVPKSVSTWEKDYLYSGENYSIVPYIERHPCALELKEIYDNAKAEFRSKKNG